MNKKCPHPLSWTPSCYPPSPSQIYRSTIGSTTCYPSMALKRSSCYCYYSCYYRRQRNRRLKQKQHPTVSAAAGEEEESFFPSVVRIVLAGGMVEVYPSMVPAAVVMENHPGLCVARPEIFSRPQESLVGPTEKLLPGEKFYLVPQTTVKKLRQRQGLQLPHTGVGMGGDGGGLPELKPGMVTEEGCPRKSKAEVSPQLAEAYGQVEMADGELICSANDFYVSKARWREFIARRRLMEEEEATEKTEQQRPPPPQPPPPQPKPVTVTGGRSFTPTAGRKLTRKRLGWKPSLGSIEEISP